MQNLPVMPLGRSDDLRVGDVITHLNDQEVHGMREGLNRVASTAPGAPMSIRILRQGRLLTLQTIVEERPNPAG